MSLAFLPYVAADLVALVVLVGALYIPRHARKDLMAAFIGVNVGILAVSLLLSNAKVGAGLGLGLFGVLSIIRLRSTELSQHEVAYFFAALALGLLGGVEAPISMTIALMALVLIALWIGDHPALLRANRHQVVVIDRAIADEHQLRNHLESVLGGTVKAFEIQRLDFVNDTTLVDVRFSLDNPARLGRKARPAAGSEASRSREPRSAQPAGRASGSGRSDRTDRADRSSRTGEPADPTSWLPMSNPDED